MVTADMTWSSVDSMLRYPSSVGLLNRPLYSDFLCALKTALKICFWPTWTVASVGLIVTIESRWSSCDRQRGATETQRLRLCESQTLAWGTCPDSIAPRFARRGLSSAQLRKLRHAVHHAGDGLGQVVIDHHGRKQYQEDKGSLVDTFFDLQADIAPHQAFYNQQQDDAAVEDGNRQ